MKRTPIRQRKLPVYSVGEERMNMITHIVGGGLAVLMAITLMIRVAIGTESLTIIGCGIYSVSMISVYTISSIYHGMKAGTGKRVMQVVDHCMIYFLIAGTYTPILLSAMRPVYPGLCWGLFVLEWVLAALAATLTAIDLKKYNLLSMSCYIGMGWAILPFYRQVMEVMEVEGFLWVLSGGIAYTVGAILYGLGKRKKWMHSIFHIFVVLGSVLQFFGIFLYAV